MKLGGDLHRGSLSLLCKNYRLASSLRGSWEGVESCERELQNENCKVGQVREKSCRSGRFQFLKPVASSLLNQLRQDWRLVEELDISVGGPLMIQCVDY